jgi:mRNA interferase YafQ
MRTIERSKTFKKDLKRELAKPNASRMTETLRSIINLLLEDKPLPAKFKDHALAGALKDFRDWHVRPDLVLLYERPDPKALRLVRLGSHAELFG